MKIGISGWRYASWRGVFYPPGLPQRRELAYAAARMDTIEINGSFYSLQRPEYYRAWHDETPDDFVFAVKGSRFITHMKRLRDVGSALSNFFASGVLYLGRKLGPVLWQFPERLAFDSRFDEFFATLPRDTDQAAALAAGHDERVAGRSALESPAFVGIRHAVEVRHPSFCCPEFIAVLRRHRIALVIADTAGRWPLLEDVTADFVYVRLHGDSELYRSGYSSQAITYWAKRVRAWHAGSEPTDARRVAAAARRARARDVYVYFDNDIKVHAPFDALALRRALEHPGADLSARAAYAAAGRPR